MALSVQDFAAKVKAKYPEYQGVDDSTLTQKIISKYPEYKSQVDMSTTGSTQVQPQVEKSEFSDENPYAKALKIIGTGVGAMTGQNHLATQKAVVEAPELTIGAGKGALNSAQNLAEMTRPITNPSLNMQMNAVRKASGNSEAGKIANEYTTPSNDVQKVGYGAEQVAEFLIPAGAASKANKTMEVITQATKLPKLIKGGINVASKAGIGALESGGVSAIQQGEINDTVKQNAIIGGGIPIAGAAIKSLGKIGGEVASHLASTFSGTPKAAIEQAFKNPEAVQAAINRAVQDGGDAAAQRIFQQTEDALKTLKAARSQGYENGLKELDDSIMKTKGGKLYVKGDDGIFSHTKLSTAGLKNIATQTLKDFGAGAKGRMLDFSEMAIDKSHAGKLQEVVDRIYAWKNNSPTGLNKLRQVIDSYKLGGINLGSSEKQFNAIVGKLRGNLSDYVGSRIPKIAELNKQYAAQTEVIENVLSQLKLNSKDPNTALRKLVNVFNPKSEVYRPIVQELGEKAGIDLMSDIAGLTMSKWAPEGIGKYFSGIATGGSSVAALSNPVTGIPAFIASGLASSPRIVGEAATAAGKLSQFKIPNSLKASAKAALMERE